MSKIQCWETDINGTHYNIIFKPTWTGRLFVEINGDTIELVRLPNQRQVGNDQPLMLGDKECRFVLYPNGKADISVDNVFLGSGESYMPRKKLPKWIWIFYALFILMPIVTLGGGIPVALGIIGAMLCSPIALSHNEKTSVRVLKCIGIAVVDWAALGITISLLYSLA